MRLPLRSLFRSSVVASLVSVGLWYASPAAADNIGAVADQLDNANAASKDNGQATRPEIKWTPPEKNVLVPGPVAPEIKAQNDDYYSRRAKKILEAERAAGTIVHPLARANPDQQPVICDAGCRQENKAEIVYTQPKAEPKTVVVGKMVPTSAGSADPKSSAAEGTASSIDCIAGCYADAKSWPARPPQPRVSALAPDAAQPEKPASEKPMGGWSTSIAREPVRDHLSPIR